MTLNAAVEGFTPLLMPLATAAVRALILAAGAGLALAAFRVKATSARLFTWTAVLYAALAMPLLGSLLPPLAVPAPAFLQSISAQPITSEEPVAQTPAYTATDSASNADAVVTHARAPKSHSRQAPGTQSYTATAETAALSRALQQPAARTPIPWNVIALGVYVAVALVLLTRFFVGLVLGMRLIKASSEIIDPRVSMRLASQAKATGLALTPQIAESELISVPVTMGVLHSTILLPDGWCEWDETKLDAVIVHEVSHVARRDALTQRISLLHRAIFWFSPLAWWLERHLANLAEQASDEAALSCGADRNDYARTLLGFFEALHAAPGRVWWQGVSMAKPGQAEKRLEKILAWRGAVSMGLKKSIAVVIIAVALPVVYLAAAVHPVGHERSLQNLTRDQDQTPPPAVSAAPTTASAPVAPDGLTPPPATAPAPRAGVSTVPPTPALAPVAGIPPISPATPMARVAPVAPVPPAIAWSSQSGRSYGYGYSSGSGQGHGKGYRVRYGYDDDQRFVIVSGKTDSLTMSGTGEDARHAEKLKKQIPGDFIWFSRDEKSYIIRDQATIDRARQFWAPQEELGKKQEELGRQQEALGKQQEELGAKMEQVHVKVPDMTAQLDKLRAELKQLSAGSATMDKIGEIQSEIGELQSRLGEIQSQAGDQQGKLGEEMGALGEKQGKLGEEQGKLGEQQGELAEKASKQMKELLDEALKNGTAKPEPESGSASL